MARSRPSLSPLKSISLPALAACALCAVFATADAGTFDKGTYTSSFGYTIEPPEDWKVVDRGNHGVMKDEMPESLASAPASSFDVLFFDGSIESDDEAPTPLYDNIMVVVVPSMIDGAAMVETADTETAASFAAAAKPELEKLFSSVELQNAVGAKHNGRESIDIEWSVEGEEGAQKGFLMQSVLPGASNTLIVTCTFGIDSADEYKETCTSVLDSIAIDD